MSDLDAAIDAALAQVPLDHLPPKQVRSEHYGPEELNGLGYRGPEFGGPDADVLTLVTIGDSWTEGSGVPGEQVFGRVLCDLITRRHGRPARHVNLGCGGKGPDYLGRILISALPALRPDLVVWVFPADLLRREYLAADGRLLNLNYGAIHALRHQVDDKLAVRGITPDLAPAIDAYFETQSLQDYTARLILSMALAERLLAAAGVPWVFTSCDFKDMTRLVTDLLDQGWLPRDRFLGQWFTRIDLCSLDDNHPGPQGNAQFAQALLAWLEEHEPGLLAGGKGAPC